MRVSSSVQPGEGVRQDLFDAGAVGDRKFVLREIVEPTLQHFRQVAGGVGLALFVEPRQGTLVCDNLHVLSTKNVVTKLRKPKMH